MSINRSTPKNGTSPISYGRPSWNPRCCFVCSLWISTLRSPAKQSAVIFSFALAWEKKNTRSDSAKVHCCALLQRKFVRNISPRYISKGCCLFFRYLVLQFQILFQLWPWCNTRIVGSSSIFLGPVGALSHKNVLYDDIGKTVKAKWNAVILELYNFILDIFVANCWFGNFLTQK